MKSAALARGALRALLCCALTVAVPAEAATTAAAGRAGKPAAANKKPTKLKRQATLHQPSAALARRLGKGGKAAVVKAKAPRQMPARAPAKASPPAVAVSSPAPEAPTAKTVCRKDGRIFLLASCES